MIYLGTPYSHENQAIMYFRYAVNKEMTAMFLKEGKFVYSPIVHNYDIAREFNFPTGFEPWKEFDLHMVDLSHTVYVLTLPGWERSVGLQAEMEYAIKKKKWIVYVTPKGSVYEKFRIFLENI